MAGIGGSDGAFYEDHFDRVTGQDGNQPDTPSTMAGRATEKPAGALKSSGGTQTPDNVSNIEDRTDEGLIRSIFGHIKSAELKDRLSAFLENPKPGTIAQTLTAREKVIPSEMGNQLGLQDIKSEPFDTSKLPNIEDVPEHDTLDRIIKGMGRSVISGLTYPGDVMQGKADPMDVGRALDTVSLGAAGLGGLTKEGTGVTLGTFGGAKAARAMGKMNDLGMAQVLEGEGAHPSDILKESGWFRGVDNKWRFEIDDSKSSFDRKWWTDIPNTDIQAGKGIKLGDALGHPDLYKAYPWLKDVNLVYDTKTPHGAYWNATDNAIHLSPAYAENQGILMHEVQHAIQDREGFARGGAPGSWHRGDYSLKYNPTEGMINRYETYINHLEKPEGGLDEDKLNALQPNQVREFLHLKDIMDTYVKYADAGNRLAAENYRRLAGEVESNNVDARLLMSAKDRLNLPPWETHEVKYRDQIVRNHPVMTTPYEVPRQKSQRVKPQ